MFRRLRKPFCAATVLLACGCGGANNSSTSSVIPGTMANAFTTAYHSLKWGSTVTASFPTTCTMKLALTGLPNYTAPAYYLQPATSGQTVVATTPVSGLQLAVNAFSPTSVSASTATLNICPAKASATTATSLGVIGYLISGVPIYNAFEATGTAALGDNVTYTFKDSLGVMQSASFLDSCNMHPTPLPGYTLHYHGVPDCVTSQVDTATGPSHMIGIALDGFPIYGGRDINGTVIPLTALDACNGITSITPEFATAAYHYVLPIGVTSKYSSMNCYAGSVSTSALAHARRFRCQMKNTKMVAMNTQTPAKPNGAM